MKITVNILICAEFDVLFGFESATRSILPVLRWLFSKRLGKCDLCNVVLNYRRILSRLVPISGVAPIR